MLSAPRIKNVLCVFPFVPLLPQMLHASQFSAMELCGRIVCALVGVAVWFIPQVLVYVMRSSEHACDSDATRFEGMQLAQADGFFDAVLYVSRPINSLLQESPSFYIALTFLTSIWIVAANAWAIYSMVLLGRPVKFMLKAFAGFMVADGVLSGLLWLPPAYGFIQPYNVVVYLSVGFTAACTSQFFSGRLCWVLLSSFDFWHFCKAHPRHKALTVALILLVTLNGFVYTSACRHVYGVGTLSTLCVCALACNSYVQNNTHNHTATGGGDEDEEELSFGTESDPTSRKRELSTSATSGAAAVVAGPELSAQDEKEADDEADALIRHQQENEEHTAEVVANK